MSKFEKVRGMHNIPVEETHYWSHVLNFSEKLMKSFSYSEIRLPIIEYTNLFEVFKILKATNQLITTFAITT